jgi:hypothetical protein
MKRTYFFHTLLICFLVLFSGCLKDLDTLPLDPNVSTSNVAFDTEEAYLQVLAKLYAGYAVSGQQGPAGQADISGIDEGFGQYLRGYWYHQELTTDEAVIGWNDQTIKDFHNQTWTASDGFTYAFYSRIFYQVAACNEYLRQTTDARLDERGVSSDLRQQIKRYRAEARFLRALSYWHALDLFRSVPFATEADPVGSFVAKQATPQELFTFIESELKAIEPDLASPRSNAYGRADQAASWMLLSKLYLNAEVYISQKKYAESLQFAEKVINAGFTMEPVYSHLFLADNNKSSEIIFPVNFDGVQTRTWGGMTFIIRAGIGGSMNPALSGVSGGWGGSRTTRQLIEKFPADLTGIVTAFNAGKNYPKVYIPGSYQSTPFNGSDTKNTLSSAKSNKIYEGYRYFPTNNSEFVILRNPSSTLSGKLGDNGGDGKLETGGANIQVAEKGFYYIKVDLNNNTYQLVKQDWSITGSALPGGTNAEFDLTWNAELGYLIAKLDLQEGSFKFRANKSNTLNLGDNGSDGLLEADGSAIQITKSGGYEIRLDLTRPDYTYELRLTSFDKRGIFHTAGQKLDIDDLTLFTDGYAVSKFKNVTSSGARGKDSDFPDTDFPMFRLADAYLMASEALLRSAGDKNKALQYFNKVRERAFSGTAGNVTAAELDLNLILDERARELYWECHRRTDLIRFGQFTDGNYKWQWKGGVKEGAPVPAYRNIFPIPSADINANPNLDQNPGY